MPRISLSIYFILIFICSNAQINPYPNSKDKDIMNKGTLLLQDVCEMTLTKNPYIKQSIWTAKSMEGSYRASKSQFDWNFSSSAQQSKNTYHTQEGDYYQTLYDMDKYTSNSNNYYAGVSKSFITGTRVSPGLTLGRTFNNLPDNTYGFNNSPALDISVTQPLLKGIGTLSAAANVRSAKIIKEAYVDNLRNSINQQIYSVVLAYWEYLASYENLALYTASEQRAKKVYEITQALIEAEKRAPSDLIQVNADVAEKTSQRINVEQRYFRAKQNLGRNIGLSNYESQKLPEPKSVFPSIDRAKVNKTLAEEDLIILARRNRYDLMMNKKISSSKKLLSKAYEWDRLPQLDLEGFAQYYGNKPSNEGDNINVLFPDIPPQPTQNSNVGFKLTYTFPFQNNLARGYHIQNLASYEQQRVTELNQDRNMTLNIRIASNALGNYTAVLNNAQISYEEYQKAFENEQLKFKQGMTTLLNLIQIQDRLVYAHASYISAKLQFARALAELRFETGTLTKSDIINTTFDLNVGGIDTERLYTTPQNP
jgi:outer membrane protein TolC